MPLRDTEKIFTTLSITHLQEVMRIFVDWNLEGPVLAILCAVWRDNNNGNNDGIPPTSGMLLQ